MCAAEKGLTPEERAAADRGGSRKAEIDGKIASGVREFKYDKKAIRSYTRSGREGRGNERLLPRIAEHIVLEFMRCSRKC